MTRLCQAIAARPRLAATNPSDTTSAAEILRFAHHQVWSVQLLVVNDWTLMAICPRSAKWSL
ncbi:MAG: hypothetical protein ACRDYZ_03135 [Acidimicrobiales bacterium]